MDVNPISERALVVGSDKSRVEKGRLSVAGLEAADVWASSTVVLLELGSPPMVTLEEVIEVWCKCGTKIQNL